MAQAADAIDQPGAVAAKNRPRALIQMATGSGKTFTAISAIYRLIRYADAKRVLFLVDRANLGRQTFNEFQQYTTPGRRPEVHRAVQRAALAPTRSTRPLARLHLHDPAALLDPRREADLDESLEEGSIFEGRARLRAEAGDLQPDRYRSRPST